MAARRGKSQAKRHGSGGLPGWAWLVMGVVLTLLAVLFAPRLLKQDAGDGFLRIGPKPNPDAQPAAASADSIAPDVASDAAPAEAIPKPKQPQYDFYTLLPGEGVQMTDAELAASTKAEAEATAKAAQLAAAAAQPADAAAGLPKPISETPPPAATAAPTATTAAATPPTATTPVATTSSNSEARYLLQAGAFGASGDAEAAKAKIALLGLNARVESAQIGGKTVYRVRMGPYGSASELADAKAKLANGGLPAMAVKTH